MNIPMVDLKGQYLALKDEIDGALLDALQATQFILGPNVQAFEQEAADYLGVKNAIGVATGTDALHLALVAAGIGKGDEVITTPFTFIATAEAISYVGATPVFVDIDPSTFNIDLDKVEQAITDKTRAVLPVHLFGQPVDMHALVKLCDDKGLDTMSTGATIGLAMELSESGVHDFGLKFGGVQDYLDIVNEIADLSSERGKDLAMGAAKLAAKYLLVKLLNNC